VTPSHILVIGSEPLARKILDRLLRRFGYWPEVVSNELDALDALERTMVDVMIIDTETIGLDFAHLIKLVRMGRLGMDPLPVIALTIDSGGSVSRQLDELGLEAVLTKPVSPRLLLEALASVSQSQASSRAR
jgi:CheY-like chemotaxis protein